MKLIIKHTSDYTNAAAHMIKEAHMLKDTHQYYQILAPHLNHSTFR